MRSTDLDVSSSEMESGAKTKQNPIPTTYAGGLDATWLTVEGFWRFAGIPATYGLPTI